MVDQDSHNTSQKEPTASANAGSGVPSIFLKGEIEIYPDARLPHLDHATAKAYAARGRNGEAAFAMVTMKHMVPRMMAAPKYNAVTNPYLPKLLGSGVVDWAPESQQKYVFIFENKLGKPLLVANAMPRAAGLKNDLVMGTVVKNIVPVLRDMRDTDFVHGNIRPENIFDGGSPGLERSMLGECLSSPPGFVQPSIYMTIERAMADPTMRGEYSYEDDMFALGASLAVLLRQHDAMTEMNENEMLQYRIDVGSFVALTGKDRFNGTTVELLRGLLHDDVRLRWTIDDVMSWMDGNRINPKQTVSPRTKASRPIEFSGHKYIKPAMLAANLYTNPGHCLQLVESGEMLQWVNRSLQDTTLEKRYEESLGYAQEGIATTHSDRVAAYISMAFMPNYPIMYRGVKFMPDGFGRGLIDAVVGRKDLNIYTDIIQQALVTNWITHVEMPGIDIGTIASKFDSCRGFLRQSMMGYGLERCIYYMVPDAPCLSDKLKDYYVRNAEELLEAYEKMASTSSRPEGFFDRHIAAFLSVRDRGVIDSFLPDLASDDKYKKILGALRVLSTIQKRSRGASVPALSAWLSDFCMPLIKRFHDRDLREDIKSQLAKLRDKGDLVKLATLLDNATLNSEDYRLYRKAMSDYAELRKEAEKTGHSLHHDKNYGRSTGYQFSCLVSGVIAAIIIFIVVFSNWGGLSG